MSHPAVAARPFQVPEDALRGLDVDHHSGAPKIDYHYHPVFELICVEGGAGRRIVGDRSTDYAGADLVLLGPDLPHAWEGEPDAEGDAGSRFTVALFSRESLGLQFLEKPELRPVGELLRRASRGLAFPADVAWDLAAEFAALAEMAPGRRLLAVLTLLDHLAGEEAAELVSERYGGNRSQRDHERFSRCLAYIRDHDHGSVSLAEMAGHLAISVPSFTRFFKRMTGDSFVNYINARRIDRACILLRETDLPVIEICHRVGFENLSHFNRQFRKLRGVTPTAFRRGFAESPAVGG